MIQETSTQLGLLPYQVFISYAKEDGKEAARFYDDLTSQGVRAWIDMRQLNPGENWDLGIRKAIRECSYVIVLLSGRSVGKRGYVQKEIREALDIAETIPDDQVFIIPVRLEPCEVPERLTKLQWCDAFVREERQKLFNFLKSRLGISSFPLLKEQERELRLTLAPDLIADSLLFRKFIQTPRVLRSKTAKGPLYIANDHCVDVRKRSTHFIQLFDEIFPHCEKQEANVFRKVIPPADRYREPGKEICIADLMTDDPFGVVLIAQDGTEAGIDLDYWNSVISG